jgi:hypothetical protein
MSESIRPMRKTLAIVVGFAGVLAVTSLQYLAASDSVQEQRATAAPTPAAAPAVQPAEPARPSAPAACGEACACGCEAAAREGKRSACCCS